MAVDETEEGAAEPKKKGGGLKILIILAVLLFVFIGVAVGGLIAYNKLLAPSLGLPPLFGAGSGDGEKDSQEEAGVAEKSGVMHPLPPFIVNLAESSGNRFIKVTLQLELSNKVLAKELTERLPQIQDQIITVLSSKKMDEVLTAEGKFRLKSDMMTRVNQFLRTGKVSNIFYTEFVVQ